MDIVVVVGLIIAAATAVPVFLQLRQHPRGLRILFFAEMWERFSYYGMRALLIFYLTQHFLFDDKTAAGRYGAYTTLVALLPLGASIIADRILGTRKAVAFGALLLVAGHLTMALEGKPAQNVLQWEGHSYAVQSQGRGSERELRLSVDGGLYPFHAGPSGGLEIEGLPAGASLPAALPKGSYE